MNIITIIMRNVIKHRFLFLLNGILMTFLCLYLIIGGNVLFSINNSLREAIAQNITGDAVIVPKGVIPIDWMMPESDEKKEKIVQWEKLLTILDTTNVVEVAAPRYNAIGMIQSEYNILPFIFIGSYPLREEKLLSGRTIYSGTWFSESDSSILLYYRHADYLMTKEHERVGLGAQTLNGYSNFISLKQCGSVDFKDVMFYSEYALKGYLPISFAKNLVQDTSKGIHQINCKLREGKKNFSILKDKLKNGYDLYRPEETSHFAKGIYKLTTGAIISVAIILLIIVILCESFLIKVTAESRRHELGVYKAMGVDDVKICSMLGGEFLIVLICSAVLGSLLALGIQSVYLNYGINASIIPLQIIFGRSTLYIKSYLIVYIITYGILGIVFLTNLLFILIEMSRLNPIETIAER